MEIFNYRLAKLNDNFSEDLETWAAVETRIINNNPTLCEKFKIALWENFFSRVVDEMIYVIFKFYLFLKQSKLLQELRVVFEGQTKLTQI